MVRYAAAATVSATLLAASDGVVDVVESNDSLGLEEVRDLLHGQEIPSAQSEQDNEDLAGCWDSPVCETDLDPTGR
jgi:hypothetical protein